MSMNNNKNNNNGTHLSTNHNSPDNVIKPINLNDYTTVVSSNNNTLKNNDDYEHVDHPTHYNNYSQEVIDMMEKIWGTQNLITFCEMNAFKYRMRMGTKPDNPIQQDLDKEKWYLNKAKQLREKN